MIYAINTMYHDLSGYVQITDIYMGMIYQNVLFLKLLYVQCCQLCAKGFQTNMVGLNTWVGMFFDSRPWDLCLGLVSPGVVSWLFPDRVRSRGSLGAPRCVCLGGRTSQAGAVSYCHRWVAGSCTPAPGLVRAWDGVPTTGVWTAAWCVRVCVRMCVYALSADWSPCHGPGWVALVPCTPVHWQIPVCARPAPQVCAAD